MGFKFHERIYLPALKKRVTFSSLGTKVCIRQRHFHHPVRDEIRLSSNSHRVQHEQTDVTSFWRTQVRRGMQTFFFRDGWKWTQDRANDLHVCQEWGTPTNCVINAATIFENADQNDIFDLFTVQQEKGFKYDTFFFCLTVRYFKNAIWLFTFDMI